MKHRTLAVTFVLAALPLPLGAQSVTTAPAPAAPGPPVRSMVLDGRGNVLSGVTVNGVGSVTVPAASARLTLAIFSATNTPNITRATLQNIADAMARAHVDPNSIVLPFFITGDTKTNNASISGSVSNPTPAMVQDGITQLASAFASLPGVNLGSAQVALTPPDCANLRTKARALAVADAKRRANALAHEAGVQLGRVLAISANEAGNETCMQQEYIGPNGMGNQPFTSLNDLLSVRVSSYVSITYAIK